MVKIIDEAKIKIKNKVRDDSCKECCDKNKNNSEINEVHVIRSVKGELQLWEIHMKIVKKTKKSKKEVSK